MKWHHQLFPCIIVVLNEQAWSAADVSASEKTNRTDVRSCGPLLHVCRVSVYDTDDSSWFICVARRPCRAVSTSRHESCQCCVDFCPCDGRWFLFEGNCCPPAAGQWCCVMPSYAIHPPCATLFCCSLVTLQLGVQFVQLVKEGKKEKKTLTFCAFSFVICF